MSRYLLLELIYMLAAFAAFTAGMFFGAWLQSLWKYQQMTTRPENRQLRATLIMGSLVCLAGLSAMAMLAALIWIFLRMFGVI